MRESTMEQSMTLRQTTTILMKVFERDGGRRLRASNTWIPFGPDRYFFLAGERHVGLHNPILEHRTLIVKNHRDEWHDEGGNNNGQGTIDRVGHSIGADSIVLQMVKRR